MKHELLLIYVVGLSGPTLSKEMQRDRACGAYPHWWYRHVNVRDSRVEVFTDSLYAGRYVYSYVARATSPGVFAAPPTQALELYAPETFGRGPSALVRVVEAGSRSAAAPSAAN
jgi:uncharacterized protein YfaS (alpha-2-macroglobulin family)